MNKFYLNVRKKGMLTLFLSALFCFSVMAQKPEAVIAKTETLPIIDGEVDEVWSTASKQNLVRPFINETPTVGAEGETYWQMLWADTGIFILVTVADDAYAPFYAIPTGEVGNQSYRYDKVEVYFDCNYVKEDGFGGKSRAEGHYTWQPAPEAGKSGVAIPFDNNTTLYAYKENNPDYVFEFFIPFSVLKDRAGIIVDKLDYIGFDLYVVDNDVLPVAVRNRMVWGNVGTITESYSNMDESGLISLDGAEGIIYIDAIELADGAITVNNEKYQITATLDPVDATVPELKWTLTNGTGRAIIDSKGLITPLTNGTVTVMAAAIDGGWAESNEVTITISGQIPTLSDISFIANGEFDEVNTGTTYPKYWAGAGATEVVEGIAITKNTTESVNPWNYKFDQVIHVPFERKDEDFKIYFKAWAPEGDRVMTFNFEDSNNGSLRYGVTTDPESDVTHNYTSPGRSEWRFVVTTVPTNYEFNVKFTDMAENANQIFDFFVGEVPGMVYFDSVYVVAVADLDLVATSSRSVDAVSMKIYPNPIDGSNILNVVLSSGMNERIAIYNSFGQKVIERMANGNVAKFDVSALSKGMYFVKTEGGKTQKFIK